MATENELQKAHQEGYNAGQLEARVAGLEDGLHDTAKALEEAVILINSTVTTVQLLTKDIQSRADADKKLQEQRDRATTDTARAIKEEKDNAARVIKEEKDNAAMALSNETNKTFIEVNKVTTKWQPRMGWATYILIVVGLIAAYGTFYATFHK